MRSQPTVVFGHVMSRVLPGAQVQTIGRERNLPHLTIAFYNFTHISPNLFKVNNNMCMPLVKINYEQTN